MSSGLSSRGFLLMQKFIEDQCGIAIHEEKAYLIESRLSRLMIDSGLTSFEEFFYWISSQRNSLMVEKIIDAMTTNETLWFRDAAPWYILEEVLLPGYIDDLRSGKKPGIRIWSAACSTGQEPYSIAMCIDNYLSRRNITDINLSHFEVVATDISRTVLDIAEEGRYDSISIMRGLSNEYKDKYFTDEGRVWTITDRIRDAVSFRQFNLQRDFSIMGGFDMVFCRYVFIYFSENLRKEVLNKTAQVLKRYGVLLVGGSELITDYEKKFSMEQHRNGVFYRLKE